MLKSCNNWSDSNNRRKENGKIARRSLTAFLAFAAAVCVATTLISPAATISTPTDFPTYEETAAVISEQTPGDDITEDASVNEPVSEIESEQELVDVITSDSEEHNIQENTGTADDLLSDDDIQADDETVQDMSSDEISSADTAETPENTSNDDEIPDSENNDVTGATTQDSQQNTNDNEPTGILLSDISANRINNYVGDTVTWNFSTEENAEVSYTITDGSGRIVASENGISDASVSYSASESGFCTLNVSLTSGERTENKSSTVSFNIRIPGISVDFTGDVAFVYSAPSYIRSGKDEYAISVQAMNALGERIPVSSSNGIIDGVCCVDASLTNTDSYIFSAQAGNGNITISIPVSSNQVESSATGFSLLGNPGADLAGVAESQIGNGRISDNFIIDNCGTYHYATKYGFWAAEDKDPAIGSESDSKIWEDNWSFDFARWCVRYSLLKNVLPGGRNASDWEYAFGLKECREDKNYQPATGDLVFLDTDGNSEADHVGIVRNSQEFICGAIGSTVEIFTLDEYRNSITAFGNVAKACEAAAAEGTLPEMQDENMESSDDENGESEMQLSDAPAEGQTTDINEGVSTPTDLPSENAATEGQESVTDENAGSSEDEEDETKPAAAPLASIAVTSSESSYPAGEEIVWSWTIDTNTQVYASYQITDSVGAILESGYFDALTGEKLYTPAKAGEYTLTAVVTYGENESSTTSSLAEIDEPVLPADFYEKTDDEKRATLEELLPYQGAGYSPNYPSYLSTISNELGQSPDASSREEVIAYNKKFAETWITVSDDSSLTSLESCYLQQLLMEKNLTSVATAYVTPDHRVAVAYNEMFNVGQGQLSVTDLGNYDEFEQIDSTLDVCETLENAQLYSISFTPGENEPCDTATVYIRTDAADEQEEIRLYEDNGDGDYSEKPANIVTYNGQSYVSYSLHNVNMALLSDGDSTTAVSTVYTVTPGIQGVQLLVVENKDWAQSPVHPYDEAGQEKLQKGEALRVRINYAFPRGTLTESNHIFTYQLPSALKLDSDQTINVLDSSGKKVGTLSVTRSGQITLDMNDAIADNQISGISAFANVDVAVDSIEHDDLEEEVDFGDGVITHLYFDESTIGDMTLTKEATNVDKITGTATHTITVHSASGTSSTVTVNDVMDKIHYTGNMQISGLPAGSTWTGAPQPGDTSFNLVLPQMGQNTTYTITYETAFNDGEFAPNSAAEVTGSNTVTATSKDGSNRDIIRHASTEQKVGGKLFTKAAGNAETVDGQNYTYTWYVEVDGTKTTDLNGYVLSDPSLPQGSTVTIREGNRWEGKPETSVSLPYTFSSNQNNKKWTFTITQPLTGVDWDNVNWENKVEMHNTAVITPPTGNPMQEGADGEIAEKPNPPAQQYENPLTKEFSREIDNGDGTLSLEWHLALDTSSHQVPQESNNQWELSDWVDGDDYNHYRQWFTKDTLLDILSSAQQQLAGTGVTVTLKARELIGYNIEGSVEIPSESLSDTGLYKKFTLSFSAPIPQGVNFQLNGVTSIGEISGLTTNRKFVNHAQVGSHSAQAEHSHYIQRPTIIKVDARAAGENTEHDIMDDGFDSNPQWKINVAIPAGYYSQGGEGNFLLCVDDTMPDHLTVTKITMKAIKQNSGTAEVEVYNSSEGWRTFNKDLWGQNWALTTHIHGTIEGNTLHINIPNEFVEQSANIGAGESVNVEIKVETAIDPDAPFTQAEGTNRQEIVFPNHVSLLGNDHHTEIDEDTQIQTVTKDMDKKGVRKSANVDWKTNIARYTLEVNPYGKKYLNSGQTLTVIDRMIAQIGNNGELNPEDYNFQISFVPFSLKVYNAHLGADGHLVKDELLPHGQYSYTVPDVTYNANQVEADMHIQIPDQTPLIIEYAYKFNGNDALIGQYLSLNNNANLKGVNHGEHDDNEHVSSRVETVQAGADHTYISLYKTASGDYSMLLNGAQFKISVYENGAWHDMTDPNDPDPNTNNVSVKYSGMLDDGVTPNPEEHSSGRIIIDMLGHEDKIIEVKETAAPAGYLCSSQPMYFYVLKEKLYQEIEKPTAGTNGNQLNGTEFQHQHDGGSMVVEDEPATTDLLVRKMWRRENGENITDSRQGSISVKLYRIATQQSTVNSGTVSLHWNMSGGELLRDNNPFAHGNIVSARYPAGTVLTAEFDMTSNSGSAFGLEVGGVELTPDAGSDFSHKHYTIQETVGTGNRTVNVRVTGLTESQIVWNLTMNYSLVSAVTPTIPDDEEQRELVGTYAISSANGWQLAITDLPTVSFTNGVPTYYTYYGVEQTRGSEAEGWIAEPGNIFEDANGTITFTNTVREEPQEIIMPETGGSGIVIFPVIGTLFMGISAAAWLLERKKARQNHA